MGQKVKTFFHVFTQSLIPNLPYYRKLVKVPFVFSLKYFVALVFFVNLIFLALFTVQAAQFLPFKTALINRLKNFPPNLKIFVRNGVLSTSYDRPYMLWVDNGDKKVLLAVIDETATPEEIHQYQSYALFTANHFVLNGKKLGTETNAIPYAQIQSNFTFEKKSADQLVAAVEGFLVPLVLFFLVASLFFLPLFVVLWYLALLAVISVFCYFFFKIFSNRHSFVKTYQLSLHAVTLPLFLAYTLNLYRLIGKNTPLLFTGLIAVFVVSALYEAYIDKK